MICCEDGLDYVPYGRQVMKNHPGLEIRKGYNREWWSIVDHNGLEEELYISNRTVVWSRGQAGVTRVTTDADGCNDGGTGILDGKTSVDQDNGRSVVCTLSMESVVKQALFTTFYTYPDQPAMLGRLVDDCPTGEPQYSLCVLEKEYLTVYTETGEEFNIALPFAVEKAWSVWYGLLIQRQIHAGEPDPPHPLLFSLLHPLEEINPVNQKMGSSNAVLPCYGTDREQSIVMTSHYPSVALTHSGKNNSVSMWRIRRCNMEENAAMVHNCSFADNKPPPQPQLHNMNTNTCNQSFYCNPLPECTSPAAPLHFTPSQSVNHNHTTLNFTPSGTLNQQTLLNFTPIQQHNNTPTLNFTPNINAYRHSPLNSRPQHHLNQSLMASPVCLTPVHRRSPIVGTVRTPVNSRLRSALACTDRNTPRLQQQQQLHASMGVLFSRTPSPTCIRQHILHGVTPSPKHTPRSVIPRTPAHSLLNDSLGEVEPLIPDLCFELLWTDQTPTKPHKAFLSEDCVGQRFLCLLLHGTVRLIKYEHTNDMTSLVFGSCCSLTARDVAPLPSLRMMLLVDETGSLSLYSGLVHVCRIHATQATQSLNTTLFKDFSSLNISCQLFNSVATPLRRSSLIVTSRPSSAMDKFDVPFSPVVPDKRAHDKNFGGELLVVPDAPSIQSLHDAILQRVTLEHSSGLMNRITLPDLWSSSLVGRVLAAFKYILPRDSALQFIARWYSARNSPGCGDFSAQGEWLLFSRTLLTMVGYDTDKLQATCPAEPPSSHSPVAIQKKVKTTENGSDRDWEYLLSSQYHRQSNATISEVLQLGWVGSISKDPTEVSSCSMNTSAVLFSHMPAIFYSLHLLYEELKCCTIFWDLCALLVPCLSQLAADLGASAYLHHYWKDFPTICSPDGPVRHLSEEHITKLFKPGYFTDSPPNFMATLLTVMKGESIEPFPYIPEVCPLIRSVLLVYCVAASDVSLSNVPVGKYLRRISPSGQKAPEPVKSVSMSDPEDELLIHEKVVLLTDCLGLTNLDVQLLAPGLSLLLMNAQHRCRIQPPLSWHGSTYELINRPDMVQHSQEAIKHAEEMFHREQDAYAAPAQFDGFKCPPINDTALDAKDNEDSYKVDGMDSLDWAVLRMRWPADKRVKDVRQMLNSGTPVQINIKQRPEVSDREFLEEQERYLLSLCIRTMALSVGRGMLTLSTLTPVITETLTIPPLTLTGKAAPRGTIVGLNNIDVPPNMNMWPLFHNGVAAALKVRPSSEHINTSWILYNRPKAGGDATVEHAGFLLGLGLCGHTKHLSTVGIHEYLSRAHELTSVGLLLGLAVARRGTCHTPTTKLLSIHLECLLPPTCTELDIPHTVQVSSILGIGLLYQGSGHRHMSEVLLREIGRPPGPEMENSNDRESYSLAAGLGLGLVMFGRGVDPEQFADLDITGQLYHYIEGGYQKSMTGPTRDKYKSPSYQIKEGKRVNIDVTSPGATLALGMIYFNSCNKAVAQWMVAPETVYLLDHIRPDFLLLCTISLGLIMWSEVEPSTTWLEKNIPNIVLKHVTGYEETHVEENNVDYETMYQAFFNLIAGSCMVLGLKFAGSANDEAFQVLYKYTTMLFRYSKNSSVTIIAGKSSLESCLCACLLSLALVMAGTGDLEVLQLVRYFRDRVGPLNASVGFGSHMAIHMSLGFLFLGGGRFTLSTEPLSVAALLIACFPKMPQCSGDNRYHLQAFRHLYVVACEPRLLMPVDVDTGALCRAQVALRFSGRGGQRAVRYTAMAPLMLPELSTLQEVAVETDPRTGRYWPLRFSRDCSSTWSVLESLLRRGCGLALKLREGEAPRPLLPAGEEEEQQVGPVQNTLDSEQPPPWIAQDAQLVGIGGHRAAQLLKVLVGVDLLSSPSTGVPGSPHPSPSRRGVSEPLQGSDDAALRQLLTTVVYDNMALGKPEAIASWLTVIQGFKKISQLSRNCGLLVWQIKLIHGVANFMAMLSTRDHSRSGDRQRLADAATTKTGADSQHRLLHQSSVSVNSADTPCDDLHTSLPLRASADSDGSKSYNSEPVVPARSYADLPSDRAFTSLSHQCSATTAVAMEVSAQVEPPQMVEDMVIGEEEEESSVSGGDLDGEVVMTRQLVTPDQAISLRCRMVKLLDCWSEIVAPQLTQYLLQRCPCTSPQPFSPQTALTLLLYDVPHCSVFSEGVDGAPSKLQVARRLHGLGLSPAVVQALLATTTAAYPARV